MVYSRKYNFPFNNILHYLDPAASLAAYVITISRSPGIPQSWDVPSARWEHLMFCQN